MRTRDYKLTRLACMLDIVPCRVEYCDSHSEAFTLKFCVEHAVKLRQDGTLNKPPACNGELNTLVTTEEHQPRHAARGDSTRTYMQSIYLSLRKMSQYVASSRMPHASTPLRVQSTQLL